MSYLQYAIKSDGFSGSSLGANKSFVYLAIRRPNKPPTSGMQVFNKLAASRTGTGVGFTVSNIGFNPDLVISHERYGLGNYNGWFDRLRVNGFLSATSNSAEGFLSGGNEMRFDKKDTFYTTTGNNFINGPSSTYTDFFFRRAPGCFDIVCYTGNGGPSLAVAHQLKAAPELWICKARDAGIGWVVGCSYLGADKYLGLNNTGPTSTSAIEWNNLLPTSGSLFFGNGGNSNGGGTKYVAYLFASYPGVSKVGSFTGNGGNQTINCTFTTGARFILIKRADVAGDWYVWDSVRGVVAGNDPHLSLNTTAAEVAGDDSIDIDNAGFIVNQVAATNINVSGGVYIFFAIS